MVRITKVHTGNGDGSNGVVKPSILFDSGQDTQWHTENYSYKDGKYD